MTPKGLRFAIAASAGLCMASSAVAVASATLTGGGRDIASAAPIRANRPVQGKMIDGALGSGFSGAFYKIAFVKGDRISIRSRTLEGTTVPCLNLFLPGTDDARFAPDQRSQWMVNPTLQTRDGTRALQTWVAGKSGAYILVVSNLFLDNLDCLTADPTWRYRFTVTAPHLLRLALTSSPKTLTVRTKATIVVSARNGLARPVGGLPLVLSVTRNGHQVLKPVRATLARGRATFTFIVPAGLRGKKVKLSASGGDGTTWVEARAARTVEVR